ncbi:hypothetical protein Tco_0246804 [Tanacetum coccineum]
MVVLESCPKHNMVTYLEKTKGNAEFHEITDFLKRRSIHHALTDEGAPSENDHLNEASTYTISWVPLVKYLMSYKLTHLLLKLVRNFWWESCLPRVILQWNIKIPSGYEGDMTLQSVYDLCLSLCAQVSDQAKEIQHLKAQIKKLKKQANPVIKHHRAWLQSVSLKQRLARKRSSKKQRVHKESVSKQGRKFAKVKIISSRVSYLHEIPKIQLIQMEIENASDEGEDKGYSG